MSRELTDFIKEELFRQGAVLVGIGDLTGLPADVREGLPVGICVAAKYPAEIIQGIAELPTQEYYDWYTKLNEQLDAMVTFGAETLRAKGFQAVAKTRAVSGNGELVDNTTLPHKTVATRAGLGWIGKSALFVNETYGSMIRISSILTDAPLETAVPVDRSKCGDCMICKEACPAGAVSGREWDVSLYRDEFFDVIKCRATAKERSRRGFGSDHSVCGKCIEVCPYTRAAWG